jgi:hypothetical protein
MKSNSISKQMIEGIVRNDNSSYVDAIDEKVNLLMRDVITDLSTQVSYVSTKNVVLQSANELLSGAMTDNSRFVYFLGIDNVQIDLNTRKDSRIWKELKDKIIYAWRTRGSKKRAEKRMQKASAKQNNKKVTFDPSKYSLFNLSADLQLTLSKNLTKTTLIYLDNNAIRIVGKEEFGSNTQIIIYVTLYDGEKFKYFLGKKEGYLDIDISKRINAINKKLYNVGDVLIDLIKIYNVLYFDVNNAMPNQIFVESLFCNCPEELFDSKDVYKSFVKIVNYFTVKSIKDFKSIISDKSIFKDKLCGNSAYGHSKLLNSLIDLQV